MGLAERGYYTRDGLADMFGVKPATISKWEQDGLPFAIIGRNHFYKLDRVTDWMDSREQRKSA